MRDRRVSGPDRERPSTIVAMPAAWLGFPVGAWVRNRANWQNKPNFARPAGSASELEELIVQNKANFSTGETTGKYLGGKEL